MALTVSSVNPLVKMRASAIVDATGISAVSVEFEDFNRSSPTYSPTSTPPVTKIAAGTVTPGSGTVNLDLSALTDILGNALDLTGLKIVTALFTAPSTNAALISIEEGASNGYQIQAGQDLKVYPGGTIFLDFGDGLGDVGGTDEILDIIGTDAGDSLNYVLCAG